MASEAEAWRATNSKKRMALMCGICANSSEEVCSTCLTICRTDFVFGIASRSTAAPGVEEESRDLERANIRRVSVLPRTSRVLDTRLQSSNLAGAEVGMIIQVWVFAREAKMIGNIV